MKKETENLDLLVTPSKETYSSKEKKIIMDMLNSDRRIKQEEKVKSNRYNEYTTKDKLDILDELNERRLSAKLYDEIKKRRIYKKKKYDLSGKKFYKFVHMEREYYLDINDYRKISSRPTILTLYYKVFGELKKKDFLIKIEIYSDKIFISDDILRIYFKGYTLEGI